MHKPYTQKNSNVHTDTDHNPRLTKKKHKTTLNRESYFTYSRIILYTRNHTHYKPTWPLNNHTKGTKINACSQLTYVDGIGDKYTSKAHSFVMVSSQLD